MNIEERPDDEWFDPGMLASQMHAEFQAAPDRSAKGLCVVWRKYSRLLKDAPLGFVLDVARVLFRTHGHRWFNLEILLNHKAAFASLGKKEVEEFGEGMDHWGYVDAFGRLLSGPAWLRGRISDALVCKWARSKDRWWRRAALVSTVALNVKSSGGDGDTDRTLAVCRLLVDDDDDMVYKAMSWALRELVPHDAEAVRGFLSEHDGVLATRVKREVNNKLRTGLKNPKHK